MNLANARASGGGGGGGGGGGEIPDDRPWNACS